MPKIRLRFDQKSIQAAIDQLHAYSKKLENAGAEIAKRLADIGYDVAYGIMQGHVFSGETAESLTVQKESENKYILYAASQAILFFEFGAGATHADRKHPWNEDFGFGPGTYPGNGHWDDPEGWWFPTDDPRLIIRTDKNGQGWGHSYGNRPHMPFYLADKAIKENLLRVTKEVLSA